MSDTFSDRNILRAANADPCESRSQHRSKSLKSDMKKATAFAKRMRTFSDPNSHFDAVNKDLDSISLGMFVSEAAQHVAQGLATESKLKFDDALSLVDACGNIHRRYEKFQPELESKMAEVFPSVVEPILKEMKEKFAFQQQQQQLTSSESAAAADSDTTVAAQTKLERCRVFIRVAAEMVYVCLLPPSLLRENVLEPMLKVFVQAKSNHHTKSSLEILNIIVKSCGIEITGGRISVPKNSNNNNSETETENSETTTRIASAKQRDNEKYAPDIGTCSSSKEAEKILEYLKTLCRNASGLGKKLKLAVEDQWKKLLEKTELQGENTAAMVQFKKVKEEVESILVQTEILGKSIGDDESVAGLLPFELQTTSSTTKKESGVSVSSRIGEMYTVRDAEQLSRFDDEEQALFYEAPPMIDHLLPQDQISNPTVLFSSAAAQQQQQQSNSDNTNSSEAQLQGEEATLNLPKQILERLTQEYLEKEKTSATSTTSSTPTPTPNKVINEMLYKEIDQHISRIPQECVATSYADQWTTKFLLLSTKLYPRQHLPLEAQQMLVELQQQEQEEKEKQQQGIHDASSGQQQQQQQSEAETNKYPLHIAKTFFTNCRRRLMKEFRYCKGNALEMVPFYARVVSILSKSFKDIGEYLMIKFEGDSVFVMEHAVQGAFSRRMRNVRFLAELTKFKVAPPGRILRVMTKLIEQLDKENVNAEVLVHLFEHVGPYLARGGVTATKLNQIVLDTKTKLGMCNLSEYLLDQFQYCFELIKKATTNRASSSSSAGKSGKNNNFPHHEQERSPLELYVRHLLFHRLEPGEEFHEVHSKLLRFPWSDAKSRVMLANTIRDASSCRWDRLYLLAKLVSRIAHTYPFLALNVLDSIFEDLRLDLEFPDRRPQQHRLQDLKYIGELFVFRTVPTVVLLYLLAQLILYFPHGSSYSSEKTNPLDYSRIRCVCTLLETTTATFCDEGASPFVQKTTKKLLFHFFHFIHLKTRPLPHDLDIKLAEIISRYKYALNSSSSSKLFFPASLTEAEKCIQQYAQWEEDNEFEQLLLAFQNEGCSSSSSSSQSSSSNMGFIQYSLSTAGVITKPWQLPVIDGVLYDSSSSTSMATAHALEKELNAFAKTGMVSADARAVGDISDSDDDEEEFDDDEEDDYYDDEEEEDDFYDDDEEEEEEEEEQEEEEKEKLLLQQEEKLKQEKRKQEEDEDVALGTFTRGGGHWAKHAAARKQKNTSTTANENDENDGNDQGEQGPTDELDDLLHDLIDKSTVEAKEKTKTSSTTVINRRVEERLAKLRVVAAKTSSQKQKQQQNENATTSTSSTSNNNNNNNNNENSSSKQLADLYNKEHSKTTKTKATTNTAVKMSILKKSGTSGATETAKTIFVPSCSDLVQANIAAKQQHQKEQQEIRSKTLEIATQIDDSDVTVVAASSSTTGARTQKATYSNKKPYQKSQPTWEKTMFGRE